MDSATIADSKPRPAGWRPFFDQLELGNHFEPVGRGFVGRSDGAPKCAALCITNTQTLSFAPHQACPSCLSGKSKETEKLNDQYKDLAMNLNPKFAQETEHSALESASQ